MSKKWCVALVCLLVAGITGCGQKAESQVEITLIHGWGTMEADHVAMREIYKDFEKENPDISLNLISLPSSEDALSKAGNMLAAGRVPDLLFCGGSGKGSVYEFMVDKGYAVDLMPYIDSDSDFAGDIAPELIKYWTTEQNRLYTVSDVLLLSGGYWYNEDIFAEAGITKAPESFAELLDVCEKISSWAVGSGQEVVPLQLDDAGCFYLMDHLLSGAGHSGILKPDERMKVDQQILLPVLEELKHVYGYGLKMDADYGFRDVLEMFKEGKSAMYINGVWVGAMIPGDMRAAYAPMPGKDGKSTSCISACVGYIVGNTGDERRMEASIRFIKYMLSDAVQERILLETGQMPSNPSIEIGRYQEQMPRFYQAVSAVQEADVKLEVPDNMWGSDQCTYFTGNIMNVMNDSLRVQTFMDQLR